jgi:D-glycero-alpha-D-manno-heptose-7-phosphate kinase
MIIRSKAPLRLGLAGGGTDIAAYYTLSGGYVLNATIDLYAYCSIEPLDKGRIIFQAADMDAQEEFDSLIRLERSAMSIGDRP